MDGEEPLIIPCEVAVKSVVPAVKALMAKELVEKHGLKQDEAAKILGISQSAVSKYTRKIRGYVIELDVLEGIHPLVDMTIKSLEDEDFQRREFLALFCQMCAMIRKTGVMCQFCKKTEPAIEPGKCGFCLTHSSRLAKR